MGSEKGDTLMVIIAILASVIILVVFPLLIMADNVEDSLQATLQTELDQFASEIANKKVLTLDDYSKLVSRISNPNVYDVTLEIQQLDENIGKKAVQINSKVQGENVYITMYHSQVMDILRNSGKIELDTGDTITVAATSLNQSTAGQLTRQSVDVPEHSASSTKSVP